MKQVLVVLVLMAAVFMGCSTGGSTGGTSSNNNSNNNNSSASPSNPANLPASGAVTTPSTLSGVFSAFNTIPSNDPVLTDLQSSLSTLGGSSSTSAIAPNPVARAIAKALKTIKFPKGTSRSATVSSDITTQLKKIETDINNFSNNPVANPLNESITLSGDSLSTYLTLTKATGTFAASITTTDGLNIANDGSNFKSAQGNAGLTLQVDLNSPPPSGSDFKYFTLQVSTGVTASVDATTVNNSVEPSDLTFNYPKQSVLLAVSFDNSNTGGKFILVASLPAYSSKITGPVNDIGSSSASTVAPNPTITLTVYKDDGTTTFTKTWTDVNSFETDLNSATS